MSKIAEVKTYVKDGKIKIIPRLIQVALDEGNSASEILNAMIEAMGEVGDKFSAGEIFVPEMLIAGKAMKDGVEVLRPHLVKSGAKSLGKCVIGTVVGDLHDIGKNLVALMIEGSGFDIIDLGVDVSADKFITAIKVNSDVKIVACSALLTTTMPALKDTVTAIKDSGLSRIRVMVGGAPITQKYADSIGADGYARDAGGAAEIAKNLIF